MKFETIPHTPIKVLLQPHYFEYEGETLKIPELFCFDGASVPQGFSWIFPPNDNDNSEGALEHDYLTSQKCNECQSRYKADVHYKNSLNPFMTRWLAFFGVRIGGWYSYKKDTNYKKYKGAIEVYKSSLTNK